MKYIAEVDGSDFPVEILDDHHVRFGGEILEFDLASVSGQPLYSMIVNNESYEGYVYPTEGNWQVLLMGRSYSVNIADEREKRLRSSTNGGLAADREFILRSPMPGLVNAVLVSEGELVQKGQILAILESMKMQNELRSPFRGNIGRLKIKVGDNLQQKQFLLSIVPEKINA
jgi:geranyl-CoA carboxylase alpha subunit